MSIISGSHKRLRRLSNEKWALPRFSVLITGGAGFIGAHLVRALLEDGANVHLLVRNETNLDRLVDLQDRIGLHAVNFLDAASLEACIDKCSPHFVFNLAIRYGHPETPSERRNSLSEGAIGLFNLLEAFRNRKLSAFIHTGSTLEYGQSEGPLSESNVLDPVSFRGVIKASQTMLCRQSAREFGLPVRILRPFSVYGPLEDERRFIPTLMRAAFRGEPVSLTATDVRHDFVFVYDVVRALLLACQGTFENGEAFNIGTGVEHSNQEVLSLVEKVTGRKILLSNRVKPLRIHDAEHWVAATARSKEKLGFEAQFSLAQGLSATWRWYLGNHPSAD